MAEVALQFADVEELVLTQLNGHLRSPRHPRRAHVEIKLESFEQEGELNGAHLQLEVTATDAERPDGEVIFDGLASYYVRLREGLPVSEVGKASLFVLVWPYLRASMQDQAARFGHGRMSLPLYVSLEQLMAGESEAGSEEET